MPAIASIKGSTIIGPTILTSDAAIGVDRTFDPAGFAAPGVAKWVDRSGGIPVGYPTFTLSVRPPSNGSRITKVTAKLTVPTMEQTSASTSTGIQPQPTVAYINSVMCDWLLHERSTVTERIAIRKLFNSLMFVTVNASDGTPTDATGTPIIAAVDNGDPPY